MLIPFDELFARHQVSELTGVLHVGAHWGQELPMYRKLGLSKVVFVEADPDTFKVLVTKMEAEPNVYCLQECVADQDGKLVTFHRTNNQGQSSSFLELGTHAVVHPDVVVTGDIQLRTKRLDSILKSTRLAPDLNFLNMDLQGAELFALKGLGDYLYQFKVAYLEVNKQELYKGCALVGEIDDYMLNYGFNRVETKWQGNFGWGDALYIAHDRRLQME